MALPSYALITLVNAAFGGLCTPMHMHLYAHEPMHMHLCKCTYARAPMDIHLGNSQWGSMVLCVKSIDIAKFTMGVDGFMRETD